MLSKKMILNTAMIALLGVAPLTQAESTYYVKASFGQASVDISQNTLPNFDENNGTYGLTFGIKHNDYISTEFSLLDYGNSGKTYGVNVGALKQEVETTAYAISTLASFPITTMISVYGKLGLTRWENELEFNQSYMGLDDKTTDQGIDLHWGAGVAFEFSENVTSTLEYHGFQMDSFEGDSIIQMDMDLSSWSLGLAYTF